MWKEHFGMGVVEMMAAGLITIAHNSAGPKEDIIGNEQNSVGFLASSKEEYADCILRAFEMYDQKAGQEMIKNARQKSLKFSDE